MNINESVPKELKSKLLQDIEKINETANELEVKTGLDQKKTDLSRVSETTTNNKDEDDDEEV